MPSDAPQQTPLKKLLPFTAIGIGLALIYVAWTFYSRHESEVRAEQQLAQRDQEKREHVVEQVFGNGEIKFTAFAADTGTLSSGEKTRLCYGVMNAVKVTLDPPVEPLKPTYHHCLDVAPRKTTTYTITATDAKGHSETQTLTIHVN